MLLKVAQVPPGEGVEPRGVHVRRRRGARGDRGEVALEQQLVGLLERGGERLGLVVRQQARRLAAPEPVDGAAPRVTRDHCGPPADRGDRQQTAALEVELPSVAAPVVDDELAHETARRLDRGRLPDEEVEELAGAPAHPERIGDGCPRATSVRVGCRSRSTPGAGPGWRSGRPATATPPPTTARGSGRTAGSRRSRRWGTARTRRTPGR